MEANSITPGGLSAATRARPRLAPRVRRALLFAHIVAAVGLLGEVSGFLVVSIRAAGADDPSVAAASYDLLATFSAVFGIPLSMVGLASGIVLGRGSKWGVFRTPWVAIKLGLMASVILVGALVLGPSVEQARAGVAAAETRVIAGAAWDVLALTVATGLSVYKPGKPRRRAGASR